MNARLPLEQKYFGPAISSRDDVSELFVDCGDCRIRTLVAGSGPPLILVHGIMAYSFSWRYNIDAFAQTHTVYAVDGAGVGFSERKEGLDVGLRASAERLLRFMDALGISSADLVGTSHGGALSIVAAGLAPERFDHIVLVAPVNPWSKIGRKRIWLFSTDFGALCMRSLFLRTKPLHRILLRRLYADPSRIQAGTMEGYAAPHEVPGALQTMLVMVKTWHEDLREIEPALARLREKQVLLLWGDRDRAVDPRSARELKKRLPSARVEMMHGVGHLPYEEVPEEFNRIILEFLQ
jgi:pimeloyl-ACP methyl ester carboxylesterase